MTTSRKPWHLTFDAGDMYELHNTSGHDASDVEIIAVEAAIEYFGRDYVRKVPSIPNGQHHTLGLRPVWRSPQPPHLQIDWTADGQRHQATVELPEHF
jgi:hypothetical protein